LALDLGVFHRKAHEISLREALGWTVFWVVLGLSFSGVVYLMYEHHWGGAGEFQGKAHLHGVDAVVLYLTGYLLEESLSVDNLFVISLLMTAMRVPGKYQHRLLFWGILGALVFRGTLVISGIRMLFAGDDEEPEPEASWFFRGIRKLIPIAKDDHGSRLLA